MRWVRMQTDPSQVVDAQSVEPGFPRRQSGAPAQSVPPGAANANWLSICIQKVHIFNDTIIGGRISCHLAAGLTAPW